MSDDFATLVLGATTDGLKRGEDAMRRFSNTGQDTERKIDLSMKNITKAALQAGAGMLTAFASFQTVSAAINAARDFDAAMAETSTLIEGTAAQMAELETATRSLAVAYGTSGTEQVRAFYQALSSGAASVGEAATLVDTANRLAVGGVTDVTTAVDILSTATNVYAAEGLKAVEASDALFVGMKAGKTTITQLSASLGTVLPLAQKVGVSFDETVAAVSALTKGGLETTAAVTGLRAAMTAVLGPSKEASDLAKELGLDFSVAALEAQGFAGFMSNVVDKTDGSTEAMATLFGSIEATTAALSLSGAAGGYLNEILVQMESKAGQTAIAVGKIDKSLSDRMDDALSSIADILLGLGMNILPVLVPLLETTALVLKAVADNSDTIAVALGAMAIVAGGSAVMGLGAMTAALWAAHAAGTALGFVTALLSGPYGLVILAGLAAGGIYAMNKASRSAADAAMIQADAEKELTAILDKATGSGAALTEQKKKLAQASLNEAKATLAAAQAALAYQQTQTVEYDAMGNSLGTSYAADTRSQSEAVAAAQAALDGIAEAIRKAGVEVDGLPSKLEIVATATANVTTLATGYFDVVAKTNALGDEQLATLLQANELKRLEYGYGQDSYLLAQARHEQEMASLEAQLEKDKIYGDQRDAIMAAAEEAFRLDQAIISADNASSSLVRSLSNIAASIRPGVDAAWQLYRAIQSALGVLGSLAAGFARMSGLAAAASTAGGVLGTVFNSKTVTTLATAFSGAAGTLRDYWGEAQAAVEADKDLAASLKGVGGGAKKATEAMTDAEKAAKKYAETMQGFVVDGISKAVDWMVSGFKGGLKGLINIFKDTISQMIAYAIKNRIMLSLGITGGGSLAGGVAQAAAGGGAGAGTGLLSGMLGGFGNTGSILGFGGLGGGTGLLGGFGNAISGGFGNLFAVSANAAAAGGGLLASIGAIAAPLLAVAAVFSFFKKKVTLLDSGLRVTVKGLDTLVETFKKNKITQFWGLSKKIKTTYTPAEAAVADPMEKIILDLQNGIMDMAATLGVGASAFEAFSKSITISTKDMTEDQARAEIEKQISAFGDAFAEMIPGLVALAKDGEGAAATLQRITSSLLLSNQWLARFETNLFAVSVAGAGLAANFADLFGSLDALNAATTFYYQNFYSDSERLARASVELGAALAALGIEAIPATRNAFRDLIDAAFAAGDTDLAAKLIQLAPAMAEITAQTDALTTSLNALENQNLYRSRAERDFAATSAGQRQSMSDINTAETRVLLAEIVRAIREGDINNARLQSRVLDLQERAQFGAIV